MRRLIGEVDSSENQVIITNNSIFQIGSYIHDDSQIVFTGNFGHDLSNQRAQQYELFAKDLHPNDTYIFYANRWLLILFCKPLYYLLSCRTFSQTGFQVELRRRRTPILLQVNNRSEQKTFQSHVCPGLSSNRSLCGCVLDLIYSSS